MKVAIRTARTEFETAIKIAPTNVNAHYRLARLYRCDGNDRRSPRLNLTRQAASIKLKTTAAEDHVDHSCGRGFHGCDRDEAKITLQADLATSASASMLMLMTPVPILLLLILAAFLEVPMIPMSFRFPLLVVNDLATPGMPIMVVGVIVAGVNRAAGAEPGKEDHQGQL